MSVVEWLALLPFLVLAVEGIVAVGQGAHAFAGVRLAVRQSPLGRIHAVYCPCFYCFWVAAIFVAWKVSGVLPSVFLAVVGWLALWRGSSLLRVATIRLVGTDEPTKQTGHDDDRTDKPGGATPPSG